VKNRDEIFIPERTIMTNPAKMTPNTATNGLMYHGNGSNVSLMKRPRGPPIISRGFQNTSTTVTANAYSKINVCVPQNGEWVRKAYALQMV